MRLLQKQYLLFFLFFVFCLNHIAECKNACDRIQEETEELKQLFRYLFAETEFGYTLLGNKPMSFCFPPTSFINIFPNDQFSKICKNERIDVSNALTILNEKKINKNYIFIIKRNQYGSPDCVFFVNRDKWIQVFNENIDAFRKVYGHEINAESFLKSLQTRDDFTDELFEQHALIGILLGYGRHNAELFNRRHPLFGRRKIPYTTYPKPSPPFLTVEEELCFFKKKLKTFNPHQFGLLRVSQVNFAADHESLETAQLHRHYTSIHRELTELFSSENWFAILLEKLCSEDSVP